MAQRNKPGAITIAAGGWWAWTRLHLDDEGITVRNYLRTYRIGWDEVGWFTDGSVLGQEAIRYWALSIVLHDGCVITAAGTSSRTWDARPGTLAAIRQTAERHAVPAVLTGRPAEFGTPDSPGLYHDPGGKPGCGSGLAPSGRRSCTLRRPAAGQKGTMAQSGCGRLFPS